MDRLLYIHFAVICFVLLFFCDRVELEVPKIEVRYRNLNVGADVQIGSRALPTLINYTRDALEVCFGFLSV